MAAYTLECASFFIPAIYFMVVHHRIFKETEKRINEESQESSEPQQPQNYESFISPSAFHRLSNAEMTTNQTPTTVNAEEGLESEMKAGLLPSEANGQESTGTELGRSRSFRMNQRFLDTLQGYQILLAKERRKTEYKRNQTNL